MKNFSKLHSKKLQNNKKTRFFDTKKNWILAIFSQSFRLFNLLKWHFWGGKLSKIIFKKLQDDEKTWFLNIKKKLEFYQFFKIFDYLPNLLKSHFWRENDSKPHWKSFKTTKTSHFSIQKKTRIPLNQFLLPQHTSYLCIRQFYTHRPHLSLATWPTLIRTLHTAIARGYELTKYECSECAQLHAHTQTQYNT